MRESVFRAVLVLLVILAAAGILALRFWSLVADMLVVGLIVVALWWFVFRRDGGGPPASA